MNKSIVYSCFCLVFFSLMMLSQKVASYKSGAPSGFSGAPATSGNTCAGVGCHFGTAQASFDNIFSNIDAGGYVPGETYLMDASFTYPDRNVFGFQMTAQKPDGTYVGAFRSLSLETQSLSSDRYITHTESGILATENEKTWQFEWDAPETGMGDVTFFAAFNAANGDNSPLGDLIFTSSITYPENIETSIRNRTLSNAGVRVFPNPSADVFILELPQSECDEVVLSFFDLRGSLTFRQTKAYAHTISISARETGLQTGKTILEILYCNGKKIRVPLIVTNI